MVTDIDLLEIVTALAGSHAVTRLVEVPNKEHRASIRLEPSNPLACAVSIGISRYDETFDVLFGRATQFSEIPLSPDRIADYVGAAVEGHVREVLTTWRGRLASSRGSVCLHTGEIFCRELTLWLLVGRIVGGLKEERIEYKPYVTAS